MMLDNFPRSRRAFTSTSRAVQAQMCLRGMGVAVLPRPLGDATAGLQRIDMPDQPPGREVWVGYHQDLRHMDRLRAMLDIADGMLSQGTAATLLPIGRSAPVTKEGFALAKQATMPAALSACPYCGTAIMLCNSVNTVAPGWVMTQRQGALWVNEAPEAEIARAQCLPGKLMPEDVAAMVLFLAADDSRTCTGQDFVVDAGWT